MQTILNIISGIDPVRLGAVAGGTRVDLRYLPGDKVQFSPKADVVHQGRVLEGHDWTLVRDDAVVVFDGRITLKIGTGRNEVAMIMHTQGRIDLMRATHPSNLAPSPTPEDRIRIWRKGFPPGTTLPVELFLQFTIDRRQADTELAALERSGYLGVGSYGYGEGTDTIAIAVHGTRDLRAAPPDAPPKNGERQLTAAKPSRLIPEHDGNGGDAKR